MKQITVERRVRGLSQAALARAAEMHPSSIAAIEHGRLIPWPGQVSKLVAALKWSGDPEALFAEVRDDA